MRINFEASPKVAQLIDRLQDRTGKTKKDLLVSSLFLLKWVLDQQASGRVVGSFDEEQGSLLREYQSEVLVAAQR